MRVRVNPDRWLVSVLVKAGLPLDFETWYQFGRSMGDYCTGGMSGGIVPNVHYTVTLALPPETENPAQVATTLVDRAAARGPYSRYGISVVDTPFTERFSDQTSSSNLGPRPHVSCWSWSGLAGTKFSNSS
jgi:hypothetical protein